MTQADTKVVDHSAMRLAGFQIVTPTSFNRTDLSNRESIPKLWQDFWKRYPELGVDARGVCYAAATPVDGSEYPPMYINYFAGVEVPSDLQLPDGFLETHVPAGNYLHYTHQGPFEMLAKSFRQAYLEWLPTSGFTVREGQHLEFYTPKFDPSRNDCEMEILIPVH